MIYLLRHCEKTGEAAEAPLSIKGLQQADTLALALAKLGIQRILSSPFLRAQQSAAPFAKLSGLTIKTTNALGEWRLAGQPSDDWKTVLAQGLSNPHAKAAGGESAAEVWARAQPLLATQTPTLLVTHGGWLSVVLSHYGRPRSLKALFALKSPDLFSIGPEGATQHEL
jgi:2,3-bisphosphoglycerate-dependent phosphoglycerate mutase